VVRLLDLRLAVVGSNPGHGTASYFSEVGDLLEDVTHRSTQPCISSRLLNRVPALAGVKAGKSPLPGSR